MQQNYFRYTLTQPVNRSKLGNDIIRVAHQLDEIRLTLVFFIPDNLIAEWG